MNNQIELKIKVEDAVRLFGGKSKLARMLKITPQALTSWGDYIPELRVYKLMEYYPKETEMLIAQSSGGLKAASNG